MTTPFSVLKRLTTLLLLAALASPSASLTAQSRVRQLSIHSALSGTDRDVWVYTPAGYDAHKAGGYPLLVTFDGAAYQSPGYMGVPDILDSLAAAHSAPPFVAVMINSDSPSSRIAELGNNPDYVRFLAEELVPWIRAGWNVTRDPHRTVITGSSAGGLGAAYAAFVHPELFGNVLSQSGAFWRGARGSNDAPYEWLTAQYAAAPKKDITFVIDVGERETGHVIGGTGPVFIDANRRLRDVLAQKGYQLTYTEVPGGVHHMTTWRPRLPVDLAALVKSWPETRGSGTTR